MGLGLRRGVGRPGCRGFRNAAGSSDNQSRSPKATPKAKQPAFFSGFLHLKIHPAVSPPCRRCGPSRVQGHRNSPQRHKGPRRRARTPAAPATHPAAAPPRARRAPSAPPAPSPEVRGGRPKSCGFFRSVRSPGSVWSVRAQIFVTNSESPQLSICEGFSKKDALHREMWVPEGGQISESSKREKV